jgi:exonuclease III
VQKLYKAMARIAAGKSPGSWPRESKARVVELQESKAGDEEEESLYFQRGGLSVSIASKQKQEWQGFGVVEEENNDDDCVKPSPLKRCTPPPPKQLPPK